MPSPSRIPSYRLHKPSGRAVVTLDGRDHYLGAHGSDASRAEYRRVINQWLTDRRAAGVAGPRRPDLSLAELMLAYLGHARGHYPAAAAGESSELTNIKYALRPLSERHAHTPAADFGPLAFKALRQAMVDAGLSRGVVNRRVGIVKRMFKWAAGEELVPPGVYHGLIAVEGLRRGRSAARETTPVKPVADADVRATLPHLAPTVAAMVRLQQLTGMRSGELVRLRAVDVETGGGVWLYRPAAHKTAHHGHARVVPIGPDAQRVLQPFLSPDPQAFAFSPARAKAERDAARRAARKTTVQPSQACRKKGSPARAPRARYDTGTYYRAIEYAIRRARQAGVAVADWHPHQLRHSAATRIRRERGLDAARAVLGHRSLAVADTYAEIDLSLAAVVAAELG